VRFEAEPYRDLTDEERASRLKAACRTAARLLEGREDRQAILARRDRLPESSVRLLARLRQEAARRGPR
jgi:hypothetical protein